MGKTKRHSRLLWWWIILACGAVFIFSSAMLIRDLAQSAKERWAWERISSQIRKERAALENEGGGADLAERYAPSGNLLIYDGLWQKNHDLAGWLTIEGLGVDLPVMYTPSEPEYYLRHDFNGDYAYSGSLFLGEGWEPENGYSIIYGHNMKDGSMFGKLDQYQDLDYAKEHAVIRFDTLTQEREYTVLTAFYSQVYDPAQMDGFRYYQYMDLADQEDFEEYFRQVQARALYDIGEKVHYGDRILILSTCSYHREEGRFVVVAYQKNDTVCPDASLRQGTYLHQGI